MSTIVLSLPFGMSARNFLRSEFFTNIREVSRLVIITPLSHDPNFINEFGYENVQLIFVEKSQSHLTRIFAKLFFIYEAYWFTKNHPIATLVRLKDQLKQENPYRYFLYVIWANVIRLIPGGAGLLRYLYETFSSNKRLEDLLIETKPDLIFTTHGFLQEEFELCLAARRAGIPIVNMVHSWDNLTSKSGLRQITNIDIGRPYPIHFFDRVFVWNRVMKDELNDLYGYPEEKITIVGIPQFDSYVEVLSKRKSHNFYLQYGMDPKKKTIYFLATSPSIIYDQKTPLGHLIEDIKNNQFDTPVQLLVRFHPRTNMSDWPIEFKEPFLFFQQPSVAFSALPVDNGWTSQQNDQDLGTSLSHADVVINGCSTTSIDAAMFDKPIVCLAYDGNPAFQWIVERSYGTSHYQKLLERGGIRVAWNRDQLKACIKEYLLNAKKDSVGRESIRNDYCFKLDGKAGKRVADAIIRELKR